MCIRDRHYPDCNEAFSPYKVAAHRHTPEIEQTISGLAGEQATITFVPHLLPVNRGIVSTIYAALKEKTAAEEIYQQYCSFYRQEQFVRVMPLGSFANLKNVDVYKRQLLSLGTLISAVNIFYSDW